MQNFKFGLSVLASAILMSASAFALPERIECVPGDGLPHDHKFSFTIYDSVTRYVSVNLYDPYDKRIEYKLDASLLGSYPFQSVTTGKNFDEGHFNLVLAGDPSQLKKSNAPFSGTLNLRVSKDQRWEGALNLANEPVTCRYYPATQE